MIAIFPEIVACVDDGDIEGLAVMVRRYFGYSKMFAPKVDVEGLLHNAGLEVQQLPMADRAALLATDEKGKFRIVAVVNESVEIFERRFLLAHMFGHFLLDIQPHIARGEWEVSGFRESVCPLMRYTTQANSAQVNSAKVDPASHKERVADDFAAAVLMPRAMVRRALEKMSDLAKLARFFAVSQPCLERRLDQIGSVSGEPTNFLEAERRLGKDFSAPSDAVAQRSDLRPDLSKAKMPRSFAASSYHRAEKDTNAVSTPLKPFDAGAKAENSENPSENRGQESRKSGLERIREIARLIDKGVAG